MPKDQPPRVAAERMQTVDLEDGCVYIVLRDGNPFPVSCRATYVEAQRDLARFRAKGDGRYQTSTCHVRPTEAQRVPTSQLDAG